MLLPCPTVLSKLSQTTTLHHYSELHLSNQHRLSKFIVLTSMCFTQFTIEGSTFSLNCCFLFVLRTIQQHKRGVDLVFVFCVNWQIEVTVGAVGHSRKKHYYTSNTTLQLMRTKQSFPFTCCEFILELALNNQGRGHNNICVMYLGIKHYLPNWGSYQDGL